MTNKILGTIAVVALLLAGYATFRTISPSTSFGAVGVKLAENYDPYIRYNGGYYSNLPISTTGGITNSGAEALTGTWTLGTNGTTISRLNTGLCYIKPYTTTIAASSSVIVDCAAGTLTSLTPLTGVTYGDNVFVNLSTTTAGTTVGGLDVYSAAASSTSGYIQLYIFNQTGGTYTWSTTGNASGTANYLVTH